MPSIEKGPVTAIALPPVLGPSFDWASRNFSSMSMPDRGMGFFPSKVFYGGEMLSDLFDKITLNSKISLARIRAGEYKGHGLSFRPLALALGGGRFVEWVEV